MRSVWRPKERFVCDQETNGYRCCLWNSQEKFVDCTLYLCRICISVEKLLSSGKGYVRIYTIRLFGSLTSSRQSIITTTTHGHSILLLLPRPFHHHQLCTSANLHLRLVESNSPEPRKIYEMGGKKSIGWILYKST